MTLEEKITAEETIYDGKILKLKKYAVTLADGKTSYREEVEHNGGACVLAVAEGEIYLVRQYRLSLKRETLELPAGKLEKGEDPARAAARELEEETGLIPSKLTKIAAFCPSTGYTNEIIHVYFADKFENGVQRLDEGEFLNVVKIPTEECFSLLDQGKIADGKTIIALQWLRVQTLSGRLGRA